MAALRRVMRAQFARLAPAAVAVALFGLLSMHGWGSHEAAHPAGAAALGAPASVAGAHGAAPGHAAPASIEAGGVGETTGEAGGGQTQAPGGHAGGSLLGLCLAVLVGLVLGIALSRARVAARIPRSLIPIWPSPVLIGRERDPPDPHQICVIRC